MDFRIIWSKAALSDLSALVRYIALDNPEAAGKFGNLILSKVDNLRNFPFMGRKVPGHPNLREIPVPPYRLIYLAEDVSDSVYIVRVWHSARTNPDLT